MKNGDFLWNLGVEDLYTYASKSRNQQQKINSPRENLHKEYKQFSRKKKQMTP